MIKSNTMRGADFISAMVLMSFLSLSQAYGAVTLTLSGIYDTFNTTLYANDSDPGTPDASHTTVFGLTQPSATVSYSFTFNDNAPTVLANGTPVTTQTGTGTLNRTWYGYSSADITSISASIGGSSWTKDDNFGNNQQLYGSLDLGRDKNIWFDQNIALAAPTRAVFDLDNSGGNFFGTTKGFLVAGDEFAPNLGIVDSVRGAFIGQYTTSGTPDVSREAGAISFTMTVPEPSRAMFLLMGLASLKLRRKRH